MQSETRNCQNCKNPFTTEPDDFAFYEKMKVPAPTFCPECRSIRRMIFLNYTNLYRKKEERNGATVFSTYPPDSWIKIYDRDDWWSDAWDPMAYGTEIDWSRPFLAQLKELNAAVPWPSKSVRDMVGSDYSNQASSLKNCYLCFNGGYSENCAYGNLFVRTKDSMDMYALLDSELCYEIYQGNKNFRCFFSSDIEQCRDVWFSRDLVDCSDCFGCVNLRHKQYCIFNVQYGKEEYERRLRELKTGSFAAVREFKEKLAALYLRLPHKFYHGLNNDNVSGDYVYFSKNSKNVFEAGSLEDVRYSEQLVEGTKDSYDYTNWGEKSELVYEAASCGDSCRNLRFSFDCWPAMQESEYCLGCHSSSKLFGCVGLRNKQYCILNKQYTKGEYEALVPKIIRHMNEMPFVDAKGHTYRYGEFFPPEFSPFAYNETIAIDYYPKTKEEATAAGYPWRDPDVREYEVTIAADALPDHISDVPDNVVREIIQCDACRRAYRILESELAFYRRFSIPLPRSCHKCRYTQRLSLRNPHTIWLRRCSCAGAASANGVYRNRVAHPHGATACLVEFKTSYAPDRPEIVYCEECYNAEVA